MSSIRATTISDLAGTGPATLTGQYAAKAWAQLSSTPTVVDSFNVSSVTDIATGVFQVNLTNAMTDGNYAVTGLAFGSLILVSNQEKSATNYVIGSFNTAATRSDRASSSAIFGDLA